MNEREKDRVERICENYALKLAGGRGAPRRDGDIEAQAANYAAGQARLSQLRADTAAILDREGVPTIVRPYYYGFVLRLAKRDSELMSEHTRRVEGRLQLELWASRGLERNLLAHIALQVLCLDLTGPEPDACAADDTRVESDRV
jgi:hypothetical protein